MHVVAYHGKLEYPRVVKTPAPFIFGVCAWGRIHNHPGRAYEKLHLHFHLADVCCYTTFAGLQCAGLSTLTPAGPRRPPSDPKLQLSRTLVLPVPSQRYRATDGKSVLPAYLISTDFPSVAR